MSKSRATNPRLMSKLPCVSLHIDVKTRGEKNGNFKYGQCILQQLTCNIYFQTKKLEFGVECELQYDVYKMVHFFDFLITGGSRAATIASSNKLFKPTWVSAEHSSYLTAFNSLANLSPCCAVIGFWRCLDRLARAVGSSLRSIWVPTIMHGTCGAWWEISGNHFSFTLSKEEGTTTEKQIKNMSVWGYDSGLNLS